MKQRINYIFEFRNTNALSRSINSTLRSQGLEILNIHGNNSPIADVIDTILKAEKQFDYIIVHLPASALLTAKLNNN